MLHLVRHGRPLLDPDAAADTWPLDPAGLADVDALRASGRLPADADWFSSPEPKARETAARLTDRPVTVVDDLGEQRRGAHWFDSAESFGAAVRTAFERPDDSAAPGWEPLTRTRARVLAAVRLLVSEHPGDLVLVGHGTAWTVLVAELTGRPPDLASWARLEMPDVWTVGDSPE
ncbi:MAG: histidine phosphatase family protein [Nocardioidaceae bacterium]